VVSTVWALLATSAAIGCSDQGQPVYWSVTDSAGVRIVTHQDSPGTGPAQWRLVDPADLVIEQDESSPDQVWSYLRSVFWLSDGSVGVGVSDPPYLRIFSPEGDVASVVAPEGDGPGEVRGGLWAGRRGDSLLVRGRRGVSVFDGSGRYRRLVPAVAHLTDIISVTPDGWIARTEVPYDDNHGAGPPQQVHDFSVVRVDRDGVLQDTLGRLEYPLLGTIASAVWPDLQRIASDGERVFAVGSDTYELREYVDRRLVTISRVPGPSRAEYTAAHIERQGEIWGAASDVLLESDREAGMIYAPPATSVRLDRESERVWVRRADDGRSPVHAWDVFQEGLWIAELEVPRQFSIREVRGTGVLGVWTDDFDVTGVRVYTVSETD